MRTMALAVLVALSACKGPAAGPIDTDPEIPVGGELVGVGVAPRDPVAAVGESVQFYATAYYENTSYEDISSQVIWTSTDTRVATVGPDGVATAIGEGETTIIAASPGGSTNQVKLTVLAGGVQTTGMVVQPSAVSLNVGQTLQLAPVATYSDGTTGTVGAACAWVSSDGAVASVSPSGLVAGQAEGSASIEATCGSYQAASSVTVVAEDVDLGDPNLTVTYFDGFTVGGDVIWFVDVENTGDVPSSGFFVDVFLDSAGPPVAGAAYDDTAYVSGLAPGEVAALTLELEDAPTGTFTSWVGVDLDGFVDESDEGDNVDGPVSIELVVAPTGPDLVVIAATALTDGVDTLYSIEVQNQGDATAFDFWIDLWEDELSQPDTCSYGDHYQHVALLSPGLTYVWEPLVSGAPPFLSYWDSWVWVDACDEVGDAYPLDNVTTFIVEEDF